jgi:hypothetical protein
VPHSSPVRAADPAIPALAIAYAVALWLTKSAYQTGDALVHAEAIRSGTGLVHPHHIAFSPMVYAIAHATGADPIRAAQGHNIAWAAIALLGIGRAIEALTSARYARLVAVASGVALGPWTFATQCEVYVPALAAAAVAFALLADRQSVPSLGLASVSLGLASLYHQTAVFFVLPASLLVLTRPATTIRRKIAETVALLGIAGGVSLAGYAGAYMTTSLGDANAPGFWAFCTQYAASDRPGWGTLSNVDAKGLYLLAHSQTRCLLAIPSDEFTGASIAAASAGALCLALGTLLLLRSEARRLVLFLLAWGLPFWAFTLWWLPREEEYLIATTPVACAALVCAGSGRTRRSTLLPWVMILAAATWNAASTVLPRARDQGPAARMAADLAAHGSGRTLVLATYETAANCSYRHSDVAARAIDPIFLDLYGDRTPKTPRLWDYDTVLVPLRLLDPATPTWFFEPAEHREGWLRVLAWTTTLRGGAPEQPATFGELTRIEAASGPFLRVRPGIRIEGDRADLLAELDRIDRSSRYSAAGGL